MGGTRGEKNPGIHAARAALRNEEYPAQRTSRSAFDAIENGGGDSGAEGESENGDRDLWRELLKKAEGSDRVVFALASNR